MGQLPDSSDSEGSNAEPSGGPGSSDENALDKEPAGDYGSPFQPGPHRFSLTPIFIRFRYVFFSLAIVLVAASVWFGPPRNQNQSIESMFAMDDQLYESYQSLKRIFGGNEVILVVYPEPELFREAGRKRQLQLVETLRQADGLRGEIIGLATLEEMIQSINLDRFSIMLRLGGFEITTNSMLEASREMMAGFTHSADGRTAALVILLDSSTPAETPTAENSNSEIVRELRNAADDFRQRFDFPEPIRLIGEPVMVSDGFEMATQDGRRLGWVATATLMAVVLVAFRSLRWTLIPAVLVQWSLLISESLIAWIGVEVTIVGSMSTSIITIITVSTTVHLITRIRQRIDAGVANQAATDEAIRELALPITFACLTDAVGFAALWFAELEPVQDFATVMVSGSLAILVAFWFLVPTLALESRLDGIPWWNLRRPRSRLQSAFSRGLMIPIRVAHRFPTLLIVMVISCLVFSVLGIQRNSIESDFTKNFRPNSEIVQSYRFVEERLGGAGVWDVVLPAPNPLTIDYLNEVAELQTRLRTEVWLPDPEGNPEAAKIPGLTKVLSLVDAIEGFSNRPIADLGESYLGVGMATFKSLMPQFQQSLYSEDPKHPGQYFYRIMLRSRERLTSNQKKSIIDQVSRICQSRFGATGDQPNPTPAEQRSAKKRNDSVRITGFYVLLTYMIDSVIRDQWLTFGLAAAGIVIMLSIAFRDIRLALIGLFPNLLPILIVLGAFGWLEIPMNLGIALIAAVAIGLSIDSSLHYLIAFQRQIRTRTVVEAVRSVQDTVGRALIYATVALMLGFSSLCFSEFLPTVYFGATAMMAMFGGLLGNLFLLPLFIGLMFKKR